MGAEGLVPGVEGIAGASAACRSDLEGSACKQEMPKMLKSLFKSRQSISMMNQENSRPIPSAALQ